MPWLSFYNIYIFLIIYELCGSLSTVNLYAEFLYLFGILFILCRSPASHSSPPNQDRAGPSDFQSFSESLKSKFNAMSMRYYSWNEYSFSWYPIIGKFNMFFHFCIIINTCYTCTLDTKNRFQRVQEGGRRGFSLVIIPFRILDLTFRGKWMKELLVYLEWWIALKPEKAVLPVKLL